MTLARRSMGVIEGAPVRRAGSGRHQNRHSRKKREFKLEFLTGKESLMLRRMIVGGLTLAVGCFACVCVAGEAEQPKLETTTLDLG